jgi:hypothetical protein
MDSLRGYYCKPSQRTGNRLVGINVPKFKLAIMTLTRWLKRHYFKLIGTWSDHPG